MATAAKSDDSVCYEGFVPCRDELCADDELHAHGTCGPRQYKKYRLTKCPRENCQGGLIALPRQRAKCDTCNWRGPNDKRKVLLHA